MSSPIVLFSRSGACGISQAAQAGVTTAASSVGEQQQQQQQQVGEQLGSSRQQWAAPP